MTASFTKVLPGMPIVVQRTPIHLPFRLERTARKRKDPLFVPNWAFHNVYKFEPLDTHSVREEFESVSSPTQLLDLMNTARMALGHDKSAVGSPGWHPMLFSWETFLRVQELLRIEREELRHFSFAETTSAVSLSGFIRPLPAEEFDIRLDIEKSKSNSDQTLVARMNCASVVHAVRIANYLDELTGVEFGKCGWCGRLFEKTTKHGREYCSNEHAHRAGQRRRRAAAAAR